MLSPVPDLPASLPEDVRPALSQAGAGAGNSTAQAETGDTPTTPCHTHLPTCDPCMPLPQAFTKQEMTLAMEAYANVERFHSVRQWGNTGVHKSLW